MNLALAIPIYKRHDLTKIVIDSYKEQAKKYGFKIIIAGSEGESSKQLAKGCHYIEVENQPLSNKFNAMLEKAKALKVEGVVIMGSDDIVNDEYWEFVKSKFETHKVIGLRDIHFYSTATKTLHYWKGYTAIDQTAGAGRVYPKAVLQKLNWKLWDDGIKKGLDTNCSKKLFKHGIDEVAYKMDEVNAFLVDIKHTISITSPAIIANCEQVNVEIMAKRVAKKTVKAVEELVNEPIETKYNDTDIVQFQSNGTYKPLGLETYEMRAIDAINLVNKGFGEIVE